MSHPEDTCERCKGPNIVWFAPSPIWNAVHGDYSILCPVCFVKLAEMVTGFSLAAWKLAPEEADRNITALEQCRCNSDMQERNPACPVHGHKASNRRLWKLWTTLDDRDGSPNIGLLTEEPENEEKEAPFILMPEAEYERMRATKATEESGDLMRRARLRWTYETSDGELALDLCDEIERLTLERDASREAFLNACARAMKGSGHETAAPLPEHVHSWDGDQCHYCHIPRSAAEKSAPQGLATLFPCSCPTGVCWQQTKAENQFCRIARATVKTSVAPEKDG